MSADLSGEDSVREEPVVEIRYIDAKVVENYKDGTVGVRFEKRYRFVVDTTRGDVSQEVRMRLGVEGNPERIGMGINGLRVNGIWVNQYKVGEDGTLRIPEVEVQRRIADEIGLRSHGADLSALMSGDVVDPEE